MERQGVLLSTIASVLNAVGSTLVNVYDVAMSITNDVLPGEKGTLKAQLREYERKIEKLYYDIGKDVVMQEDTARTKAVVETGIKLVAEYRAEMERIKQCIRKIEEEEKAKAKAANAKASGRTGVRKEPAPEATTEAAKEAEKPPAAEAPQSSSAAMDVVMDEAKGAVTEAPKASETPVPVAAPDTAESAEPETPAAAVAVESKEIKPAEELETMLKSDLLQLCREKGIEADKRMTKDAIIRLIVAG